MRAMACVSVALTAAAASGCASALVALTFFQPAWPVAPAPLPAGVTEHWVAAADGARVQLFHAACPGARRCVVYFHGTGGHAASRLPLAAALARAGEADVVVAEYRGYGTSPGEPSEAGVYADARAALRFAREDLGHLPECTVLIGRSLGSAVACEVAGDAPFAGLALLPPFASGRDVAAAHAGALPAVLVGAPFDSAAKLPAHRGPVLVVHGTDDRIVPFEQGRRLFDLAGEPKTFVRVDGGTHHRIFPDDPTGAARLAEFVRACVP